MFYTHTLRDGSGHAHSDDLYLITTKLRSGFIVRLCMLGIEFIKKKVVDIKVTRVDGVYCEDARFFFCLVCGFLEKKTMAFQS